jgi:nucleoside-diphosphate-sugar epimerase
MKIKVLGVKSWLAQEFNKYSSSKYDFVPYKPLQKNNHSLDFLTRDLAIESVGQNVIVNFVGRKYGDLRELKKSNVEIPKLLAEISSRFPVRIIHIGSAAEYGMHNSDDMINENDPCKPLSDYAKTKLEGSLILEEAKNSIILRLFNSYSNNLPNNHLISEFKSKVLNSQNNSNKVYVENYNCVRDFVSTRFLSQSIDLMIKSKEIGIYNICSGSGFSYFQIIQEMLKFQGKYCDILNLNNVESSVIIGDPNKWYSLTKTKYLPDLNHLVKEVMGIK